MRLILGGFPGPLKDVLGIWDEEIECLGDDESVQVKSICDCTGFNRCFSATHLCALIHAKGAKVLAEYDSDFFKGMAAATVNNYGKGKAYYVATRLEESFIDALIGSILTENELHGPFETLPFDVSCHTRHNDEFEYVFLGNYSTKEQTVNLTLEYHDMLNDKSVSGQVTLEPYGSLVLKHKK